MDVIKEYCLLKGRAAVDEKFVVIGLSRGASMSLAKIMSYSPDMRQVTLSTSLCNIRIWLLGYVDLGADRLLLVLQLSRKRCFGSMGTFYSGDSSCKAICYVDDADSRTCVACYMRRLVWGL